MERILSSVYPDSNSRHNLTADDLAMFSRLGITPELLADTQVRRDQQGELITSYITALRWDAIVRALGARLILTPENDLLADDYHDACLRRAMVVVADRERG